MAVDPTIQKVVPPSPPKKNSDGCAPPPHNSDAPPRVQMVAILICIRIATQVVGMARPSSQMVENLLMVTPRLKGSSHQFISAYKLYG